VQGSQQVAFREGRGEQRHHLVEHRGGHPGGAPEVGGDGRRAGERDQLVERFGQRPDPPGDGVGQQLQPVVEVVVDRARADAGLGRDGAGRRRGEALADDDAVGRVEDVIAHGLGLAPARTGDHVGRKRSRHRGGVR
jgi:hypothetical protein